jgi:glutathione synthase/RimK-type ligase-like ATP-grasp enzyme
MNTNSGNPTDYCILNSGGGAWAFAPLAERLSDALWIEVTDTPARYAYVLNATDRQIAACDELFIPLDCIELAGDKRRLARVFLEHKVKTPQTRLIGSLKEAEAFLDSEPHREWCLKYPTGCGGSGHRMLTRDMKLPDGWPLPLVVQEFVRLVRPEVYRVFCAGGELFGWIARRYPAGAKGSAWVAHARGARYELAGTAPKTALDTARLALEATGLIDSFGCADLIQRPNGEWLVLEVGTDGLVNHVDRDLDCPELEQEILKRIALAFWKRTGSSPWGAHWRMRSRVAT